MRRVRRRRRSGPIATRTLADDFIRDVNNFFDTNHTTIESAIEQVYSVMDDSPDRPVGELMAQDYKHRDHETHLRDTLIEVLRLLSTNTVNWDIFIRTKHLALFLGIFELYKYQKDANYIPDTSLLQTNVAMMGFAGISSLYYERLPTQFVDYEILFLNSIGLFAAGTQRPEGNCFREDDDRYLKVYIYNLLVTHLTNNHFSLCRVEACRVLLEPLRNEGAYFTHRLLMLISIVRACYHPRYSISRDRLIHTDRKSLTIRRKLARHFTYLGLKALFE